MNRLLIIPLSALALFSARAEMFKIDTSHAEIGFAARHLMVSNTKGQFNTFQGTIEYDPESRTLISAAGEIDAASIDTNNQKRDDHLRGEDFFNVSKFPKITFKSTKIEKTGENTFEVTGLLNILGTDRTVILPVTIHGPVEGKLIGIECSTTLNRRELGISFAPASVIGDEVKISIDLEAAN